MWVQSLGGEDPLEEGTATHSSILTWRTPWTEESGGLQSMGSKSWTYQVTKTPAHACICTSTHTHNTHRAAMI